MIPILLLFGGFLAYSGISLANAAGKLIFNPAGVKWEGIKGGNICFELEFEVTNPSGVEITIEYLFLDIKLGESKLASIREADSANKYKVSPQSVSRLKVPVKVPVAGAIYSIGMQLLELVTSGKLPSHAGITGYIRVNGFSVPVEKTIPIKLQTTK